MSASLKTFLLLDAARMLERLENAQALNPDHHSLYIGRSEEQLKSVSPYLFTLDCNTDFYKWVTKEGWGASWGVFVLSDEHQNDLYRHFRKFLIVTTFDGVELYFRFYDPRVLRIFLPTCDALQLKEFFGPVKAFGVEDEDPAFAMIFSYDNGALGTRRIQKEFFFKYLETGHLLEENSGSDNDTVESTPKKEQQGGKKFSIFLE